MKISLSLGSSAKEITTKIHKASTDLQSEILNNNLYLILMDMMMHDMAGFEVNQAKSSFDEFPITAATVRAMKGDRDKYLEPGASKYVTEPVNQKEPLGKIADLINLVR